MLISILSYLLIISLTAECWNQDKPNIIFIIADDLGWNDVSFHGSNQIPTPNIDALAYNGIMLNTHYTPALCTPSRSSLLTGKYPTSVGMQHLVILAPEPWGLPLTETLMPQYLQRHGYKTHAIGKWHLGFCRKEYTPTYRGFDTFYGYWNGYQDYYDHTMQETSAPYQGYDMRRNLEVDWSAQGKYSTDLFTKEAISTIRNHNSSQNPLFLYLAHLAPHSGNENRPFQAPDEEIAKFSHINDPERRVYAAMVSRLDQSVGEVMTALREKDMIDNSIIVFLSDNGAVTFGTHSNHGSNYPLRGLKESPWEGAMRGVAAIWSPLLNKTRRISHQKMHMADWLPTLYSAAGLNQSELGEIDGVDVWNALSNDEESPRTEILHNVDEIEGYSVLNLGDWKLIEGTAQNGDVDSWYGESGREPSDGLYNIKNILKSKTSVAISGYITDKQLENYRKGGDKYTLLTEETIKLLRDEGDVQCLLSNQMTPLEEEELQNILFKFTKDFNSTNSRLDSFRCDPLKDTCLFNIKKDPCEQINLAKVYPDVLKLLQQRLQELKKFVVPPLNVPGDVLADPALHGDVWTPWLDVELDTLQPYYYFTFKLLNQFFLEISSLSHMFCNFIFNLLFTMCSLVLIVFMSVLVLLVSNMFKQIVLTDLVQRPLMFSSYGKNYVDKKL